MTATDPDQPAPQGRGGPRGAAPARDEGVSTFVAAAVTVVAIVLLVGLAIVAILTVPRSSDSAKDVASLVAATTTVIGTIVGAYVGTRVGSQGKERVEDQRDAEARRAEAEIVRTMVLAALLPPERAMQALEQADRMLAERGLL